MPENKISTKKIAQIIVLTWILSLTTTLIVVYLAPNILLLQTNQISDNAIITAKLADGSVTSAQILDATITAVDLADGSIVELLIADGAVTKEKIENYSITSEKIAPNTIVTANLADGSVTSAQILDATITAVDLVEGSIIELLIDDGAVTRDKLANEAVTTDKIANDAITNEKLANNSVTTPKIENYSITPEKLANNSVWTRNLADGNVTVEKMAPGVLKSETSFIIWREDDVYYAKNDSGAIQFSGTDAALVINNAISSLSTGGSIILRDGTYDIKRTINVMDKWNFNLVGETWEVKLNLTENSNTDMLRITNSSYAKIASIYFQGNRESQTRGKGIVIENSERVTIEHCQIYEIKQTAIHIVGTNSTPSIQPWIENNRIEKIGTNSSDHGIWIDNYAYDIQLIDNDIGRVNGSCAYVTSSGFTIALNKFWGSDYGLNVFLVSGGIITGNYVDHNRRDGINIDACSNLLVTSNEVQFNSNDTRSTDSGIFLYNSTYITVTGNRVGATWISESETQRYGIKEYGTLADYNLIVANNVRGNLDSEVDIISEGSNTIVSLNQGRYTPNNP